jgi:hypothetical protein
VLHNSMPLTNARGASACPSARALHCSAALVWHTCTPCCIALMRIELRYPATHLQRLHTLPLLATSSCSLAPLELSQQGLLQPSGTGSCTHSASPNAAPELCSL